MCNVLIALPDELVARVWLWLAAPEPTLSVLYPHLPLVQPADLLDAEVHVPHTVVDFFQTHVFAQPKFVNFRPLSRPRRPLTRMDAGFHFKSEM